MLNIAEEEGQGDHSYWNPDEHGPGKFFRFVTFPKADEAVGPTYRQHSHCPQCWSEAYFTDDEGVQRCPTCEARPTMIVCTPIVCVSS